MLGSLFVKQQGRFSAEPERCIVRPRELSASVSMRALAGRSYGLAQGKRCLLKKQSAATLHPLPMHYFPLALESFHAPGLTPHHRGVPCFP